MAVVAHVCLQSFTIPVVRQGHPGQLVAIAIAGSPQPMLFAHATPSACPALYMSIPVSSSGGASMNMYHCSGDSGLLCTSKAGE